MGLRMNNDRFFIIARNIIRVMVIVLLIADLILSSFMLYKMAMIVLGLTISFGSRIDSEDNSKLNRKIGPWAGGLLSLLGICLVIHEIIRH